ncbi:MAG: cell division protein CrgA [Actinomycetota bacterium]
MSEKPAKRRVSGGRTTPKGTRPDSYTPPSLPSNTGYEDMEPSPPWVAGLMFGLLGLGVLTILINYVGSFWDTNNGILLLGLGMILGGIITATQYR